MDLPGYELRVKRIVESYMHTHGLASHQLESYEHFLHFMLPDIIREHSPIDIYCPKQRVVHRIFLENMCIKKPTIQEANGFIRKLTPTEAHLRKQTYCVDVFVDVTHKVYTSTTKDVFRLKEFKVYRNVLFCKIPCMLNSSACHNYKNLDRPMRDSCTFLINGNEKTIISQEKLKCNYPYVFRIKRAAKYTFRCEIRSFHPGKIRSTSTLNIYISADKATSLPEIALAVPFIKHHIPLPVIFRLLDVCDLKTMMYYIVDTAQNCSQKLRYRTQSILCNDSSNTINMTTDELYDWVGLKGSTEKQRKRRIQYTKHIFLNEFFPHCGNDHGTEEEAASTNSAKAFYLGYCVRKLLMVYLDEIPPDDIDSYTNKRCCAAGLQFALLIRQLVRNFVKILHVQVFKAVSCNKYINIVDFLNHRKISAGIKYACATGNWGIQKGMTNQSGVCQVINSMNRSSRLSHLCQVNTPINRDGKLPHPRQLHRSHWGILCAAETPEGKSVGLLNQLAMLARIRTGYPSRFIIQLLVSDMGVIPASECSKARLRNLTLVLVNGIICGGVQDPMALVRTYKAYRQWYSAPIDSSITFKESHKEVSILTDAEDCYRPLIRVDRLETLVRVHALYSEYLHLLWRQLLVEGVIEYINKEEESSLYIAMSYDRILANPETPFTHMELHPSFSIFGVSAGVIPFANHNQAPRNIYQCLEVHEPVLMTDGRRVAIKDVKVGDSVLTFDPVTLVVSSTRVTAHMITTTDKVVVDIETVDKQCITATEDHLFMTSAGWRCATQFNHTTELGVFCHELGVRFSPIKSIRKSPRAVVADITTLSSNHSFIGGRGQFLVHNSAMGKQAIAGQPLNFRDQMDTKTHVLDYPQRPPVTTWISNLVGYDAEPTGQACVVAIMCFSGSNQEDSVILNKSALDRGLFRSTFYRSIKESEVTHGADEERFTKDQEGVLGKRKADYSKLGEDGIIPIATKVDKNTVLLGKTIEYTMVNKCGNGEEFVSKRVKRDRSVISRSDEVSSVHSVVVSATKEGLKSVSVKTAASRVPEIGDKFCFSSDHELLTHRGWIPIAEARLGQAIAILDPQTHNVSYEPILAVQTYQSNDELMYEVESDQLSLHTTMNHKMLVVDGPHLKLVEARDILHQPGVRMVKRAVRGYHGDVSLTDVSEPCIKDGRLAMWCFEVSATDSLHILHGVLHHGVGGSGPLLDDLQRLALHAGVSADIIDGELRVNEDWVANHPTTTTERVTKWTGAVHCVTTRTGILYVRRRGRAAWSGNSSRHGQKGIVGMILPGVDMPTTGDGIAPDILVNCHAIPSRMTVAQLIESLLGKVACIEGRIADGTPFRNVTPEEINARTLDGCGKEVMYNGKTGERLRNKAFVGVTYYQRLRHMVQDKLHARATGPNQILTRQPVEGRSRKGGFRVGEMERDALISHGVTSIIKDRLMEQSDKYEAFICQTCGFMAEPNAPDNIQVVNILHKKPYCRYCKSNDNIFAVQVPYAFKLLTQELGAVHIGMKFKLDV